MNDAEYSLRKFQTLSRFISEISEMRNQLEVKEKIQADLEKELYDLKHVWEEVCSAKVSLEGQLANSNAEKKLLSEKLEHETSERTRVEEALRAAEASFEEQQARHKSEMEQMRNDLKNERQTMKQALDNLQQQFNTLYKFSEDP